MNANALRSQREFHVITVQIIITNKIGSNFGLLFDYILSWYVFLILVKEIEPHNITIPNLYKKSVVGKWIIPAFAKNNNT